ncbi:hypothetical protein KTN05_08005 [Paracoccus sp. Z118]|uniref:hypothetical protein n=1 Tax=Paracoccus sp. Z118 TaxID=2851017 RepID=UPI001C2CBBDE|nr:hypothetical protein [Paracoccus sp. Z118]MBV0891792.1 hypothetical protein [Paracoccus sp. Z118]
MAAPGLIPRLAGGWRAPARTVRSLRGMSDPALLALLFGTLAMYFVAQWPAHARAAQFDPSIPLTARLGGALLGSLFIMPLLAYGLAGLSWLVARAFGWRGTGADARLALIWAMAMVTPLMLLAGLTQGLVGPGPALGLVQALAGLAFVVMWVVNLRALGQSAGK